MKLKFLLFILLLNINNICSAEIDLLYFTSKTCPNCPAFYEALLSNKDLVEKYDNAYIIKKEDDEERWKSYTKLYNITSLPTLVILDTGDKSFKNSPKKSKNVLTKHSGLSKINENGVQTDYTRQVLRDILKKFIDRKSTRLNSSHVKRSRMPSSA